MMYNIFGMKKTEILINFIKQNIVSGKWKEGDKIFSENQFIDIMKVSRATVRAAVNRLILENVLESRHGAGTFVRKSSDTGRNILVSVSYLSYKKLHSANKYLIDKITEKISGAGYSYDIYIDYMNDTKKEKLKDKLKTVHAVIALHNDEKSLDVIRKKHIPIISVLNQCDERFFAVKFSYDLFFRKFVNFAKKYGLRNIIVFTIKQSIFRNFDDVYEFYATAEYFRKKYTLYTVPISTIHTISGDVFKTAMKNLKKIPDAVLFFDENIYENSQPYFEKYDSILSKTKIITHSSGNLEIDEKYPTCVFEFDFDLMAAKTVEMLDKISQREFIEEHIIKIPPVIKNEKIFSEQETTVKK